MGARVKAFNEEAKNLNAGVQNINFEPSCLIEGVPTLDIGPESLDVEPKTFNKEAKTLKAGVQSINFEPSCLIEGVPTFDIEPKTFGVGPESLDGGVQNLDEVLRG